MKPTAQLFKVLADEARLKMLWLLFNQKELCVCDFVAALQITQSKASRHLRALFHAGLVTDRKDGLWSYYSLRPLESELARPHVDLLRQTLANYPEGAVLLKRLHVWLKNNRAFPESTRAASAPGSRPRKDRGALRLRADVAGRR